MNFFFLGLCFGVLINFTVAEDPFTELKKNILESQYVFTSEVLGEEFALGKKIFVTNRVSRNRFKVAGKPVVVFFSNPQAVEPITGLKPSYFSPTNIESVYQNLTDDQGEMTFAFTPKEGHQELDIHFVNVPKKYTEHINHISFWVFDPEKIRWTFFTTPFMWVWFFLISFLTTLWFRIKPNSFLRFSRKPLYTPFDLFPYLALIIPTSGKRILKGQILMILVSVMVAFFLNFFQFLLIFVALMGLWFFRQKAIPLVLMTTLLFLFYLFLTEYYFLQSLPEYIDKRVIIYLSVITILATSPSLLAGMFTLLVISQQKILSKIELNYFFLPLPNSKVWEFYEKNFFINIWKQEYLVKDYFYLFLLSVILSGFVVVYRFSRSQTTISQTVSDNIDNK